MTVHSSEQTFSSLSYIKGITLSVGEDIQGYCKSKWYGSGWDRRGYDRANEGQVVGVPVAGFISKVSCRTRNQGYTS